MLNARGGSPYSTAMDIRYFMKEDVTLDEYKLCAQVQLPSFFFVKRTLGINCYKQLKSTATLYTIFVVGWMFFGFSSTGCPYRIATKTIKRCIAARYAITQIFLKKNVKRNTFAFWAADLMSNDLNPSVYGGQHTQ